MKKQNKLTAEELEQIDGGKLFVSVDGGEKIEATVRCIGGELYLLYNENGRAKRYNTEYDLSGRDLIGNTMFKVLNNVMTSETSDYTYKINTKD